MSTSGINLSGLASGLDWTTLVNEITAAETVPVTQMQTQQSTNQSIINAYQALGTKLGNLSDDLKKIQAPGFFESRTATSSNTGVATATAAQGTNNGTYTFTVSQLATNSVQQGASGVAAPLSSSNDVSGLVLANAGFATAVTAGTFTVNGKTITIATTDTLQSVFDQVSTATGGAVTAAYDSTTDAITLSSSSPIVLGSATDTSNFLRAAQLYSNGTGTVSSVGALGSVHLSSAMSSSNLATAITDGGSGAGQFLINGVAINYDASSDSINDVLQRIDASGAGVTATYDPLKNRFTLTNNTTGNTGITVQDVTGNFLAATGLSGGTFQAGNNLQYSVNGSSTLISQSNTVDGTALGLQGLSFTANGQGTTTVTVGADSSTIATAITNFLSDYNAIQATIKQDVSTTTASGTSTPGLLSGDMAVEEIGTTLRQMVDATPSLSAAGIKSLNDLGFASNGTDNSLTIPDSTTLQNLIAGNLTAVKNLFTNATSGIGTITQKYLTDVTSSNGVLSTKEDGLTKENSTLSDSIKALQLKVSNDQTELTNEFVAMETAINNINQQKQYLNSFFGGGSSSTSGALSSANASTGNSTSGK